MRTFRVVILELGIFAEMVTIQGSFLEVYTRREMIILISLLSALVFYRIDHRDTRVYLFCKLAITSTRGSLRIYSGISRSSGHCS